MSELRDKLEKNQINDAVQKVEEMGLDPRSMLRFSAAVGAFVSGMWWVFLIWMAAHTGVVALIIVGGYVLWRLSVIIRGAMNVEDALEALEPSK
ncbi:membrane protein [Streptomyces phage LuckySocke]|jgi:hypothetical protein|nr:membrane protein [Streptomyces phage Alone3]WPH58916.1 membrane protein [Streptomyces phage LuckySocke]